MANNIQNALNLVPSATSGIPLVSQGTNTIPAYSTAVVAGGGTGQVTLTNHGVLVGAATSAITQLATGSAGQVLQSGGASADPAYSTATYPATATGTGTILRADGTNWSATTATYPNTAGTSGNIMTSNGTNFVSSSPAGAGASWVLIQSQAASASSTIAFTSGITTYNNLLLVYSNVSPGTTTQTLQIQWSTNGGSSYISSSYNSGFNEWEYNTSGWSNINSTSAVAIAGSFSTGTGNTGAGHLFIHDVTSGTYIKTEGICALQAGGAPYQMQSVSANSNTGINAFKLFFGSGTISTGTFSLYGLREA